jgi:PhoPQ-activated pathogenicity-related protein
VSISKWTHTLAVVVPDDLRVTNQAFMYITGWESIDPSDRVPPADCEDIKYASKLALSTHSIGASLFQVPNEPIVFKSDSLQMQRFEDEIVAFTWHMFLKNTSRTEVINLNPMVKAAVRGMDTLQHFTKAKGWADIKRFVIAGASKRGWTTWLTGAADKRVKGMMPLVMDLLNFEAGLKDHYRSLGGWSFAFSDYYALNLTSIIGTETIKPLLEIIDVFNYRKYLDFPKMIVNSAGDEFFLLDDDRHWWGQIPGQTWRLMLPNAEHEMETAMDELMNGMNAFYQGLVIGDAIPTLDWAIEQDTGKITLKTQRKPSRVLVRSATTISWMINNRRDFRLAKGPQEKCKFLVVDKDKCVNPFLWVGEDLLPVDVSEGVYTYSAQKPIPDNGTWRGLFIEVHYPGPVDGMEYVFTSQVAIIPNQYPFDYPIPGEEGNMI